MIFYIGLILIVFGALIPGGLQTIVNLLPGDTNSTTSPIGIASNGITNLVSYRNYFVFGGVALILVAVFFRGRK